jgi:alpha-1,2-mannosyltransferase
LSPARDRLRIAGAVCLAFGIYGWAVFALSFRHDGLIAPRTNAPGVDFMVFYLGARAALAGGLDLLYDGAGFTAALNHMVGAWLTAPLPLHPWVYPPPFLLLLLPLGMLPFAASYALYSVAGGVAIVAAVVAGERGWRRTLLGGAMILSPAASIAIMVGQNALFVGAALIGGMRLIATRPALGGALLGLAAVKPQLFLMVPVALVASRQWRALAGAFTMALALAAASALAFGLAPWRQWLAVMLDPANPIHRGWTALSLRWGDSVYSAAGALGASSGAALAAQVAALLLAGAGVAWMFSRPSRADLRLALLLAAAVLAAPHVSAYDGVLLAEAAALFFCRALEAPARGQDTALALALWLTPLAGPPILSPLGLETPLLAALFIATIVARTAQDLSGSRVTTTWPAPVSRTMLTVAARSGEPE